MHAAIFLDKDGTLVEDVPYNVDPARIRIYPEVVSALTEFSMQGYKLLVVSNQAGIAQGYFDAAAVEHAGAKLIRMLGEAGVKIEGFYYCPHHPEGTESGYAVQCDCRKPQPGLLLRAARDHRIDLAASWMVGDILNDVEAGKRAGCRAVLVDRGNETEWVPGDWRKPDRTTNNLYEALLYILQASQKPLSGTVK